MRPNVKSKEKETGRRDKMGEMKRPYQVAVTVV
jgi:hypothetical protein